MRIFIYLIHLFKIGNLVSVFGKKYTRCDNLTCRIGMERQLQLCSCRKTRKAPDKETKKIITKNRRLKL